MTEQKRHEILILLEENARRTASEIADLVGEPKEAVAQVIAAFEHERTIVQYRALVDWDRAGDHRVTAMIDVKVIPQRDTGFDRIADRIARFPEVKSCYLMSGTYDLSVIVEAADLKAVAGFVAGRLSTIEGVASTATHFLLKRYKHDGVSFRGDEPVGRLAVTP
jgi:DNA-binding Lrp family transcriptional regulator